MMLLDASTLFLIVREADEDRALRVFSDSRVTTLTDYEMGSILWKEHRIAGRLSSAEIRDLASRTKRILKMITHVSTQPEALEETLDIAIRERVSYYDVSYIQTAKQLNLILATDDNVLAKVASRYVKTSNAKQILKQTP